MDEQYRRDVAAVHGEGAAASELEYSSFLAELGGQPPTYEALIRCGPGGPPCTVYRRVRYLECAVVLRGALQARRVLHRLTEASKDPRSAIRMRMHRLAHLLTAHVEHVGTGWAGLAHALNLH